MEVVLDGKGMVVVFSNTMQDCMMRLHDKGGLMHKWLRVVPSTVSFSNEQLYVTSSAWHLNVKITLPEKAL